MKIKSCSSPVCPWDDSVGAECSSASSWTYCADSTCVRTFIEREAEKHKRQNEKREISGGRTDRREGRKELVHGHCVVTWRCSVTDETVFRTETQTSWETNYSAAQNTQLPAVCEIITALPLKNTLFCGITIQISAVISLLARCKSISGLNSFFML